MAKHILKVLRPGKFRPNSVLDVHANCYSPLQVSFFEQSRMSFEAEGEDGTRATDWFDPDVATGAPTRREPAPDEVAHRALLYNRLSAEARDVLRLILNGPREAVEEMVTPVTRAFTKNSIARYLDKRKGWSEHRIQRVFGELADYTGNLE